MATHRRKNRTKENGLSTFMKVFIPIVLILIFWFNKDKWSEPTLNFIKDHKWFLLIGVSGMIVYISWAFGEFFKKHKQNLRKTWYFLFIIGAVLLLDQNGFDVKEWQRYTLLAGMFIFVDLALFLTPSIKKIAGAEMEQINEMESVNVEMKKLIVQTQNKNGQFTDILDELDVSQFRTMVWNDIEAYRSSLQDFLTIYGETCRQDITVFRMDDTSSFCQELGTVLGVNLDEGELKALEDDNTLYIDKKTLLIPYVRKVFPVVISVRSEKDVLDIDSDNLINLSIIHSWFKSS